MFIMQWLMSLIGQLHDDVIFTTTTRILDFVVFLCKLKLLFVLSSAGLTNLNNKAKPK